ncbi:hypothetical protein D3C83_98410 [compost metagenome]
MQARLGDAQLCGDVGVAEAVVSARLRQPLGDVENRRRGGAAAASGGGFLFVY